jgi:serine/threonine protein kinase
MAAEEDRAQDLGDEEGRAAGEGVVAAPRSARCRLRSLAFAELFGLPRTQMGAPLCEAATGILPAALGKDYVLDALLSRGAYGIVFSARRRPGVSTKVQAGDRSSLPPRLAVKVQFVCPKGVARKSLCAAYGQRASGYDTVRYEALQHARVYSVLEQLAADPVLARLPLPSAPQPMLSQRVVLGKAGEFPDVPPDGRRRLWVTAMELIDAPTLRQTLLDARRRGTLTYDAFMSLCGVVLKTLRVLHDAGYTHGDLHTGNVIIDEGRVERGERWVVFIDWERSVPREFVEIAPGIEGGAEQRAALWDAARIWDLKVFVESAVRLAESARVFRGTAGSPATSSGSSSSAPPSPRQRFRRAVDLATALLRNYIGSRAEGMTDAASGTLELTCRQWVARALWLKDDSTATLPTEVAEELAAGGPGAEGAREAIAATAAVARADRAQHRRFFSLLRAVQTFYTAPKRRRRARRGR